MIVVVLGPPRSGTSMIAGVLHNLGVMMGEDLLGPDRWNQQGYYEDRQFLGIHRIMVYAYGDYERIKLMMPAEQPRSSPKLRDRYERLIRARESKYQNWGLKDPRTMFVFDQLVELAQHQIKVVATYRDPAESIASIKAMLNILHSEASTIINAFVKRRDAVLEQWGGPIFKTTYTDFLEDPTSSVTALAEFVGTETTTEAQSFINQRLRRHKSIKTDS